MEHKRGYFVSRIHNFFCLQNPIKEIVKYFAMHNLTHKSSHMSFYLKYSLKDLNDKAIHKQRHAQWMQQVEG